MFNFRNIDRRFLIMAALIGVGIFATSYFGTTNPVEPKPPGPDMVQAFRTNDNRAEAREHARAMESILDKLADVIEYDGKRTQPYYTTGVKLDQLRRTMREYRMGGWSFANQYPDLGVAIESYMNDKVGISGDKITAAQRQKWVDSLRVLARACGYASRHG